MSAMVDTRNNSTSSVTDGSGPATCGSCHSSVGSIDYSINCEYCRSVFHHGCAGFNDSLYTSFKKVRDAGVAIYHCPTCKLEVARLANKVSTMEALVAIPSVPTETRLLNVEEKLDVISKSLQLLAPAPPVSETTGELSGEKRMSYASVASTGVYSQARVVVADLQKAKEEESHRRSIVVAGLPENGRDSEDVSKLVKLLDPSAVICETYRVGRLDRSSDGPPRPRLLKAHLPSSSVVKSVLGEARKLKDSVDFRGVFIRRSMTLDERKALGKVRAKCMELNRNETVSGVKYVVVNEHLVKFSGCHADDSGRLLGGTRDRDWVCDTDNEHLN